ncbi:Uma2 family endonuclease [Merismopedia glauca]
MMTYTTPKTLTFPEFIQDYGDNPNYELIDGELRNMEPTGLHELVAGKVTARINAEILRLGYDWTIPRTCLIKPPATEATALRPDAIVLEDNKLSSEPLWSREPVITLGSSIKLVIEVVSTNWQDDYARKVEEYALLGIPEYWIVDYRSLGGIEFIGRPKQPTITICQLVDRDYQRKLYRLNEVIISPLLPELVFALNDVMPPV